MLVCGDRKWTDSDPIKKFLERLNPYEDVIIEGEAPGADSIARDVAESMGFTVMKYPADWRKLGRAAGPIRNHQMLVEGLPEFVVAFHDDINQSKGTAHMLKIARRVGIPTLVITHDVPEETTGGQT